MLLGARITVRLAAHILFPFVEAQIAREARARFADQIVRVEPMAANDLGGEAERNLSKILISFNAMSRERQWRMNDSSSACSCP
jgi:hypothetical protein